MHAVAVPRHALLRPPPPRRRRRCASKPLCESRLAAALAELEDAAWRQRCSTRWALVVEAALLVGVAVSYALPRARDPPGPTVTSYRMNENEL